MMIKIKQRYSIAGIILIVSLFYFFGCTHKLSSDYVAEKEIRNAVKLIHARDKVARKKPEILHEASEMSIVSTQRVDDFVKRNMNSWISTVNSLESFAKNNPSDKYSDDSIFVATFLWVSISQADRKYAKDAIKMCKLALSLDSRVTLEPKVVSILKRAPSFKYIINFELKQENGMNVFLERMLVAEFLKINDPASARSWVANAQITDEEKDKLLDYISTYNKFVTKHSKVIRDLQSKK